MRGLCSEIRHRTDGAYAQRRRPLEATRSWELPYGVLGRCPCAGCVPAHPHVPASTFRSWPPPLASHRPYRVLAPGSGFVKLPSFVHRPCRASATTAKAARRQQASYRSTETGSGTSTAAWHQLMMSAATPAREMERGGGRVCSCGSAKRVDARQELAAGA